MSRCLAPALFSALLLALVPAVAAAQAQAPDERAAAQSFAAITLPAAREIASIGMAYAISEPPSCKADRRLAKGTERQQTRFAEFFLAQEIAALTRAMTPTIERTAAALDAVATADPALKNGRRAWHRVARTYAKIAKLQRVRVCSVLRDYVRGDYKPTPEMRRAAKTYRLAMRWDTTWIDRAQAKAIKRMIALGVTPENADGFDGELEPAAKPDDGGGEGEGQRDGNGNGKAKGNNGKAKGKQAARAAQAPAPSSPLTSLIAAR
jgi:hypothetical protein